MRVAAKASALKKEVQGPLATQELPPIAKSMIIGTKVEFGKSSFCVLPKTHQCKPRAAERPYELQHHFTEESDLQQLCSKERLHV